MTISTLPLNMGEITRRLILAIQVPQSLGKLSQKRMPTFLRGSQFDEDALEKANRFGSVAYLVGLYTSIAKPFVALSEGKRDYIVDLEIPWGVVNGMVCVTDLVEDAITPSDLVGDLSEGLLLCSYNEDDIREYWNKGTLNQLLEENKKHLHRVNLESYLPADRDVQSLLTFLIKQTRSWPTDVDHRSMMEPTNLTSEELSVIDQFDDRAYIKSQFIKS